MNSFKTAPQNAAKLTTKKVAMAADSVAMLGTGGEVSGAVGANSRLV